MTDFRARGTIMGLAGLTAVFGMGTGGAPPVWSPEKRPTGGQARRPRGPVGRSRTARHINGKARVCRGHTPFASTINGPRPSGAGITASREVEERHWSAPVRRRRTRGAAGGSGWSSGWLLGPVGCGGRPPCTPGLSTWSSSRSLRSNCCRKPRLEEGFALRCLQRLSFPDLATRRCPERDSRHTRGRSSPILSY